MLKRVIKVKNGDFLENFKIYECDYCYKELPESHPRYEELNHHYCGDCAFKLEIINDKDYIKNFIFWLRIPNVRAGLNPETGEIEITNNKFSWERTPKQNRYTPEYIKWRTAVFKRDNFTCVICKQRGGNLEAHHIKPFRKYKSERTKLNNGVTLCKKCHKKVHKEGNNEWLHTD